MTPAAAWLEMTRVEAKLVARDPGGLIIPIGLPLLILIMNGLGADREPLAELGGLSPFDAFVVPLTLSMVMTMIAVINMPSFLATYRKAGVLRRLGVTPATPLMVLVAQVVVALVQTLLGVALAAGVAAAAFDLAAPASIGGVIGVFALAMTAMLALGMVVAAVAPTPNTGIALGLILFFGMLALGGGLGPADALPGWLATVGEHLPYGATATGFTAAWAGNAPTASHLLALGVTAVAATAVAALTFRWE